MNMGFLLLSSQVFALHLMCRIFIYKSNSMSIVENQLIVFQLEVNSFIRATFHSVWIQVNWFIREIQCQEYISHLYCVLVGSTLIYKGNLMLIVGWSTSPFALYIYL